MIHINITPAHVVTYQMPTNSAHEGGGVLEPGDSILAPAGTVVIIADPDSSITIDLMPRDEGDYLLKVQTRTASVHSLCII